MTSAEPGCARRKLNVVFVGAFKQTAKDGAVGGSLYAARSLVTSGLAERVRWMLVDTTGRSVPPPSIPVRAFFAVRRSVRFALTVGRPSADVALIFSGSHLGFLEKGVMALFSRAMGKAVVFCPRAGTMRDAVEKSGLQRWYVRFVLSRCDVVVCQGETWRTFYKQLTNLPYERLVSIPNWISLPDYSTIGRGRGSRGPVVFLYMGWIERSKGVLDLIQAVHRRRSDLGDALVVIHGRGSALNEAQSLAKELGLENRIRFGGWVLGEQKRAALGESDVLVLPSYREGMPNALLEGMAAGMAVIATRVGGIPDVVDDGTSGLLVEPADVEALGEALVRLAQNQGERERMAMAARETIARHHDLEKAWPQMLTAIRAAADRRPRVKGIRGRLWSSLR
ncbi:MAG TPA: glycosyltransferase family 4 protein [Polyangiaceae bacterium]|jgi:glycosyltransferase involved in cell wall biosynthesis